MAQTTEAACLLQSGTSYASRIGLRGPSGEDVFGGIKAGGVSLYFGDEPIYHLDLDGRWQRAFVAGVHYLKGLDPTIRAVGRDREGANLVLRRRTLAGPEAAAFDDSVRQMALGLAADLEAGRLEILPTPPPSRAIPVDDLRAFLGKVAGWDAGAWADYRTRYQSTYPGPPPFVPPDCPNALVLQATRGRAFRGEEPTEAPGDFRRHLREVAALMGGRIAQCRDLFLGGADVLRRPVAAILADLAAIPEVFPIGPKGTGGDLGGRFEMIHAYLDDFRPGLPDRAGWRNLREAHLGRVTLGVESAGSVFAAELSRIIADLKGAGIGVGVVAMVGVEADRESLAALVASLPLGPGDLISLVDDAGGDAEAAALKARLISALPSKGPRVVAYNPEKRWT